MTDREKVIKAIELEIKHENTWECRKECPYYGKTDGNCFTRVLADALELLKEQEPVKPIEQGDDSYVCDNCGEAVGWEELDVFGIDPVKYKYCPGCGRKVEWDADT